MHSRHGSRPDGFRCIAPPRASIPENVNSLAHLSPRHKGQCLKKSVAVSLDWRGEYQLGAFLETDIFTVLERSSISIFTPGM